MKREDIQPGDHIYIQGRLTTEVVIRHTKDAYGLSKILCHNGEEVPLTNVWQIKRTYTMEPVIPPFEIGDIVRTKSHHLLSEITENNIKSFTQDPYIYEKITTPLSKYTLEQLHAEIVSRQAVPIDTTKTVAAGVNYFKKI